MILINKDNPEITITGWVSDDIKTCFQTTTTDGFSVYEIPGVTDEFRNNVKSRTGYDLVTEMDLSKTWKVVGFDLYSNEKYQFLYRNGQTEQFCELTGHEVICGYQRTRLFHGQKYFDLYVDNDGTTFTTELRRDLNKLIEEVVVATTRRSNTWWDDTTLELTLKEFFDESLPLTIKDIVGAILFIHRDSDDDTFLESKGMRCLVVDDYSPSEFSSNVRRTIKTWKHPQGRSKKEQKKVIKLMLKNGVQSHKWFLDDSCVDDRRSLDTIFNKAA